MKQKLSTVQRFNKKNLKKFTAKYVNYCTYKDLQITSKQG